MMEGGRWKCGRHLGRGRCHDLVPGVGQRPHRDDDRSGQWHDEKPRGDAYAVHKASFMRPVRLKPDTTLSPTPPAHRRPRAA